MSTKTTISIPDLTLPAPGEVRAALDSRGREALGALLSRWPVDTGRSRDSFTARSTVAPGRLEVTIEAGAGYAQHVNGGRALEDASAAAEQVLLNIEDDLLNLTLSALNR